MMVNGYLYVHYIILFALCIFEVFDSTFFKSYHHSPVVDDGGSHGDRKWIGLRDDWEVESQSPRNK